MEKKGPGRPRKEVEKPWDQLSEVEKVLLTYNDGASDAIVCKAIEISKEEFDTRIKTDDAFKRVVSFGRTLAQAWWEDKYRQAANNEIKLNAPAVNLWMKNMYGWAEKSETTNNDFLGIEGMTRDEAAQRLRELGPNIISLLEHKQQKQ